MRSLLTDEEVKVFEDIDKTVILPFTLTRTLTLIKEFKEIENMGSGACMREGATWVFVSEGASWVYVSEGATCRGRTCCFRCLLGCGFGFAFVCLFVCLLACLLVCFGVRFVCVCIGRVGVLIALTLIGGLIAHLTLIE